MRTRVTAVLVAKTGGEWLGETIAGIEAQTRAPDELFAVNNGGEEHLSAQLRSSGASAVTELSQRVPFGAAVAQGIETARAHAHSAQHTAQSQPAEAVEWVWLLTEDSCPEPDALEQLMNAVHRAPSVVVAGPKIVDWDHPDHIIELGQSMTRFGQRWMLERHELDQAQYDHLQDVLAVGPVGMLVRRDIWESLNGFDPALRVYDDALDLCVRARLAGHRVEVVPAARIRFAQSGVAGPRIDRQGSVMRAAHRQARTSQIHRRIAYAPAAVALVAWLGLPVYAVLRMCWALIREQPGFLWGEGMSALSVWVRPGALRNSRQRVNAQNSVGWVALKQLRIDPKTVRTTRMIHREAVRVETGRQPRELHFISTGGLAVLTLSAVIALVCTWWVFTHTSLTGGALAPLSSLQQLWQHTRAVDGIPADPFTWVLAVFGSLTFWNPSQSIVLLFILAIPLSALGGWVWAAQLSDSAAARALGGLGFGLSPVLLTSLSEGRITTLFVAISLPWLLLAALRCRDSWSAAGTTSLLAAVVLAAAPVLLPAAAVMLVIGLLSSVRGITRVLSTAIAPLVLFAPGIAVALTAHAPLNVLRDPGVTPHFTPGNTWHLSLGFPEFGLSGWSDIFTTIGLGGMPATLLVGILCAPIALLAVLGLVTGRVTVTLMNAALAGLGIATAIAAAHLELTAAGTQHIAVWTGSGLLLYWIALIGLASVGAGVLRRAAMPTVAVALLALTVATLPITAALVMQRVPVTDGNTQMPALVQAAGESDPAIHTLVIEPQGTNTLRAKLIAGPGLRLDQIRTAAQSESLTPQDTKLAELVAGLASTGGKPIDAQLREQNIAFVLVSGSGHDAERAALQRVFDQHDHLVSAGVTDQGLLWRVDAPLTHQNVEEHTRVEVPGTTLSGATIWTFQTGVLLAMLLLALPTGEVSWRPERRRRQHRSPRSAAATRQNSPSEANAESAEPAAPAAPAANAVPTTEESAVPETVSEADAAPNTADTTEKQQ